VLPEVPLRQHVGEAAPPAVNSGPDGQREPQAPIAAFD